MIYLDNSATTRYKPAAVVDAVTRSLLDGANPGRSGHTAALLSAATVLSARENLTTLVDGDRNHCVLAMNCTHALNMAVFGTKRLHGHVITTATEHNSVLRPLFSLYKSGVIRLTVLSPDREGLITVDSVRAAMRPDTYLVAVNLVSNVTGTAQSVADIGAMCRMRGCLLLCDGAQAVGYTPISMKRDCIDILAVAPHKGLHAPMGVGALVVGERVHLNPLLLGGTGIDSRNLIQSGSIPEGIEAGTLPYPAVAGLEAACEWTKEHMPHNAETNLELTTRFIEGLHVRKFAVYSSPNPSGVVAFNLPRRTAAAVADALNERDIYIRSGLHCAPRMHEYLGTDIDGTCRASFSCDNDVSEVAALLRALDEINL